MPNATDRTDRHEAERTRVDAVIRDPYLRRFAHAAIHVRRYQWLYLVTLAWALGLLLYPILRSGEEPASSRQAAAAADSREPPSAPPAAMSDDAISEPPLPSGLSGDVGLGSADLSDTESSRTTSSSFEFPADDQPDASAPAPPTPPSGDSGSEDVVCPADDGLPVEPADTVVHELGSAEDAAEAVTGQEAPADPDQAAGEAAGCEPAEEDGSDADQGTDPPSGASGASAMALVAKLLNLF